MGGPVCDCLLLIELLTQPLALGDTSLSLPMINLNFLLCAGLLPELQPGRGVSVETSRIKEQRRGQGTG